MNIPPTYDVLMNMFSFRRNVGHTRAMLNGAVNVQSCIVVMASEQEAKAIRRLVPATVKVISLSDVDKIRSTTYPILIDHHALQVMGMDFRRAMAELIAENASLKRALGES